MKKIILQLVTFVMASSAIAQLNNGLVSQFYFTNGTLQNSVPTSSLSIEEDGDASTFGVDRDGNLNNALSFDGVDTSVNRQKLSIQNSASEFDISSDFSISYWFKTDDLAAGGLQILFSSRQISNSSPGEKGGVDSYINGNGEFQLVFRQVGNGSEVPGLNSIKTTLINEGVWYHVAIIKSDSILSHYINGTAESRDTITDYSINNFQNVSYWNIGAFFNTQTDEIYRELDGGIDDIRLYNRALTSQEVNGLYNEGTSTISSIVDNNLSTIQLYPNPTSNYVFIEGVATESKLSLIDLQGKKIDLNRSGNKVELGKLSQGVYFLQVENNKQTLVEKLVIE